MHKRTSYVWVVPSVVLGLFFVQIHAFWDPDSNYLYGWIVPFTTAYLIWNRNQCAPEPAAPIPQLLPLVVLLGVCASFFRLIWEGMSDWFFLSWLQGFTLVAFCFLWLATWRGWRWAMHFFFPLCFALTAIPWLGSIEMPIALWLTQIIAELTSFLLQMVGIPAILEGARISIGDTVVEVAEACSGIRSLQTLLVMSLFLGEYGNFSVFKRICLVGFGIIVAFIQNAARSVVLGYITGIEGRDAYDKWHDPAGYISITLGIALLVSIYLLIEKYTPGMERRAKSEQRQTPRFCLSLSTFALCAFLITEAVAFIWVQPPAETENLSRWELDSDALSRLPLHRGVPVDPRVCELLDTYNITNGQYVHNGKPVSYFHIVWPETESALAVSRHNPSICMGQYGSLRQIGERKIGSLGNEFEGVAYETYQFKQPMTEQKLLVFRTLMSPESHYAFESLEKMDNLTSRHGKWLGKFFFALDGFLNYGESGKLPVYSVTLLSIEVDSFNSSDSEPLEDFIRRALVTQ